MFFPLYNKTLFSSFELFSVKFVASSRSGSSEQLAELPDLPTLTMTSKPLEHVTKARPRRAKAHRPTRPVVNTGKIFSISLIFTNQKLSMLVACKDEMRLRARLSTVQCKNNILYIVIFIDNTSEVLVKQWSYLWIKQVRTLFNL